MKNVKNGSDAEKYIEENGIHKFLENLENFELEFDIHMQFLNQKKDTFNIPFLSLKNI